MGIDIGIEAIFFAKEGAEGEEARAAAKALGLSGNLEAQRLEWPTEMKIRELGGLREGLALDGPVGKKQEIARIFSAFGLTNEERSSMVEMIGLGKSTPLIAAMFSWTGMSREYLEEAERQAREIPDRDLAEFGRLGERIRDEILTVRPIGRALLVSRACGFLGGSSTGKFSLEPTSGPGAALARQLARSGVEPPEARWDRFLKMEDSREAGIALTELLMRSERGDVPDWDKNASLGALKLLGHPGILETFGELAAAKARAEGSVLGGLRERRERRDRRQNRKSGACDSEPGAPSGVDVSPGVSRCPALRSQFPGGRLGGSRCLGSGECQKEKACGERRRCARPWRGGRQRRRERSR